MLFFKRFDDYRLTPLVNQWVCNVRLERSNFEILFDTIRSNGTHMITISGRRTQHVDRVIKFVRQFINESSSPTRLIGGSGIGYVWMVHAIDFDKLIAYDNDLGYI